jgi:hypothetical protein
MQAKHLNALCGKNVEILNIKLCGIQSNQSALKSYWPVTVSYKEWPLIKIVISFSNTEFPSQTDFSSSLLFIILYAFVFRLCNVHSILFRVRNNVSLRE